MSSLWEQRAARNEALFREVNENIADLEERVGRDQEPPVFVCECSNVGCIERLAVDPSIYRRVREQPWLVPCSSGPRRPSIRTGRGNPSRLPPIVEKTGAAGEVAEETQP